MKRILAYLFSLVVLAVAVAAGGDTASAQVNYPQGGVQSIPGSPYSAYQAADPYAYYLPYYYGVQVSSCTNAGGYWDPAYGACVRPPTNVIDLDDDDDDNDDLPIPVMPYYNGNPQNIVGLPGYYPPRQRTVIVDDNDDDDGVDYPYGDDYYGPVFYKDSTGLNCMSNRGVYNKASRLCYLPNLDLDPIDWFED